MRLFHTELKSEMTFQIKTNFLKDKFDRLVCLCGTMYILATFREGTAN